MADLKRAQTGVVGLDEILNGGLPADRFYLLRGAAGTGKTTLALQFLLEGIRAGEPVLYVSLSQTKEELEQIAQSHGWTLEGMAVQSLSTGDELPNLSDQTIFQSADLRLDRTRDAIQQQIEEINPTRIVYDSLLEVRLLASNPQKFRREVLGFKSFLNDAGITTILIDTEHYKSDDRSEDQLENIAHGIIRLEKRLPEYGLAERRMEIKKLRGSPIRDGYHDISIRQGEGVVVYPRLLPHLQPDISGTNGLIKCDIDNLDSMLGGGLEEGTTAIVMGQSGTGKSTLASLYARAALERGEHVAMYLFEERVETFFRRSEGLGIELRKPFEEGRLHLRDFNPSEISPGEFSQIVVKTLDDHKVRVIMIDSLTGYLSALPHSDQAVTQMHTVLKYAARRGALSLLIVAQHGLLGQEQSADLDVSYLGDSVLWLRMYEWPGVVRRTITAVKKRHGPHDLNIHEFTIGPEGVEVEEFNPPPPGAPGPLPTS
ncbi:MAG: AAA family ATPase [Alphaproteobacteria bacterium]|nr:AAA family ATPase [Alphaproteobacteria bacterium]